MRERRWGGARGELLAARADVDENEVIDFEEFVATAPKTLRTNLIKLAKTEHLTPLEERIRSLHESMNAVRDLQDGMREAQSVNHASSASTRTSGDAGAAFVGAASLAGT